IAGLAYKPDTNVVEDSQGMAVARYLLSKGASLVVFDPMAMENARPHLFGNVTFAVSFAQCLNQADVLAITTPWREFEHISIEDLSCSNRQPTVIDCWRSLPRHKYDKVIR